MANTTYTTATNGYLNYTDALGSFATWSTGTNPITTWTFTPKVFADGELLFVSSVAEGHVLMAYVDEPRINFEPDLPPGLIVVVDPGFGTSRLVWIDQI